MPDIYFDVDTALSEVPVNFFPLTDDTDFKTRETAVAYDAAGMDLVWNFVTSAGVFTQTAVVPTTGGAYDWTHQGDGIYTIEMPASGGASINNDTEGYGWFTGIATGVLPWRGPTIGFRAAALNDALLDGGDNLDVNLVQIDGSATSGGTGAVPILGIVDRGTAQGATSTTLQLRAAAAFADDELIGAVVHIASASAGAGQSAIITDYVSATDTATISPAWQTTPSGTINYVIFAAPRAPTDASALPQVAVASMAANVLTASALAADAVTEIQTGITGTGDWTADERTAIRAILGVPGSGTTPADPTTGILDTIRDAVAGVQADTDNIQTRLPAALVNGRMSSYTGEMATNVFTSDAVATSAVTEIQTGLATSAELTTVAGYIDTEVAAILAIANKIDTMLELDGSVYRFTTNALEQAAAAGGGLDAAGVRAAIGLASANLDTQLAAIGTDVDAVLVDTGTDIPALIAALNDVTVSEILTTQMTESYAANGTAPTLAQALFAIHQHLMEFEITGTSRTVKRLNSSTTAFVETLDDATTPTALTR